MTPSAASLATQYVLAAWDILLELAPWLLVGSAVAGVLHGLLPRDFIRRHLSGGGGVVKAVTFGVPLPLCSCGVIPAGLGLRRDGASRGASIGFLTSTPQTGVDSILVSASFLGWPFALFKVAAALVSGVVGGALVDRLAPDGGDLGDAPPGVHPDEPTGRRPVRAMVEHAIEILRSVWRWLVFGVLLSAAITVAVPDAWLQGLGALGPLGGGVAALLISLPLYVCATASVPIAAALVAGGMPTGAALVFLMAGPATNVATIGAVFRGFGGRALSIYLGTLVVFSLGAGVLFERVVDGETVRTAMEHHAATPVAVVSALFLILLLLLFAARDLQAFVARRAHDGRGAADLELRVDGMTCTGCAGSVERALRGLGGVRSVEVRLEEGRARIVGDVDAEAAAAAVRAAGFAVAAPQGSNP